MSTYRFIINLYYVCVCVSDNNYDWVHYFLFCYNIICVNCGVCECVCV